MFAWGVQVGSFSCVVLSSVLTFICVIFVFGGCCLYLFWVGCRFGESG